MVLGHEITCTCVGLNDQFFFFEILILSRYRALFLIKEQRNAYCLDFFLNITIGNTSSARKKS